MSLDSGRAMKTSVPICLLFLAVGSLAQSPKPCLAVYPSQKGNVAEGAALAPFTLGVSALTAHGERFSYLESSDLPIKQVKVVYSKKELEKLEKTGVKIIVTTQQAFSAKENHSDEAKGSSTNGQSSMTVQGTVGCSKRLPSAA
jgi:hypothetical protein